MTKNEFYDYIRSFNKKPGEYTEDEILDICLKHRTLDTGKNWKELVELLGLTKTGESLRKWTYRHECLHKEIESSVASDSENLQYQQLYMAKTQVRDYWNAYRKDLRDSARLDEIIESIKYTVDALKELPDHSSYKGLDINSLETEAILLLSDLHVGIWCDNFYNKYNTEIAANRVDKLVKDVISYCKLMKVKRLTITNLGDCIQGIIHTNARISAEMDVITQTMTAAEIIARALNELQDAAPEVMYRSCSDNHSRMIANKEDNLEQENLGRLIDWYLKERLKSTRVIFKDDNLDYSFGKFELLNGKKVIFSHGHLDGRNQVFQCYVGATKEYIDYILLGHFHVGQTKSFQNCKVYINGSIVGTEDYALSKRLFASPSQKLLVFNKDDVLDIDIDLSNN